MNVDYSLYEGRRVKGLPQVVMQRGNVLVEDGGSAPRRAREVPGQEQDAV